MNELEAFAGDRVMPVILFYVLAALSLVGVGCSIGWKVTSDHYEAKAAKDDRVALSDFQTAVLGMNQLSKALEESKGEKKTVYRTIEKRIPEIISRDVVRYNSDCLTDDGLRLINEALAGKLSDTAKHDDSVQAAGASGGKNGS